MAVRSPLLPGLALVAALCLSTVASATVPTYRVEVLATYEVTTFLEGASDEGHIVGSQVVFGVPQPFVATLENGLVPLPLPTGFLSGVAFDANGQGVIVGSVSENGFPYDLGDPAVWIPDGDGYTVQLLTTPATVFVAGQDRPVDGGQAVAVNDAGQIVGFSRLQGFQGGPATLFSLDSAPLDLGALGFGAQIRDISDSGFIVGGGLRMDLATQVVTPLGLPDPIGTVGFTDIIAYAVNDAGEAVVAANLASVSTENYLTYLHDDALGFRRLNPDQLPSRFVGFYDNNDLGDVSASGGVLFREEDVLVAGFDELLEASFSNWDVASGFLDDQRRVYATAVDQSNGANALVRLRPLTNGDANLDETVDRQDLLIVEAAYGSSGAGWAGGDFDRDGSTAYPDLVAMAPHYDDSGSLAGLGLDPAFLADWEEAQRSLGVTAANQALPLHVTVAPNPFNPRTRIRFSNLPEGATGSVRVYDTRGEHVRTLHVGAFTSPILEWDGRDGRGGRVASGAYFVVVRVDGASREVRKVSLVK